MSRIKDYFLLLRVKHYVKSLLVFLPMFLGGLVFDSHRAIIAFLGFITFSFLSSVIYIFNDYLDKEKDKNHPTKKYRPLANGAVSTKSAFTAAGLCMLIVLILSVVIGNHKAFLCLAGYFLLNILYSMGLKDKPIVDVAILASGFVIRVFYGGIITDVLISKWLYLVIITGSLYMGLGKRRNELRLQAGTRAVLKYYNENFLDKYMCVCIALVNVYYALWAIEMLNPYMIWTVPFFMFILMYYSLDIDGDSDGDPVEVLMHDKVLIGFLIIYIIWFFLILYIL